MYSDSDDCWFVALKVWDVQNWKVGTDCCYVLVVIRVKVQQDKLIRLATIIQLSLSSSLTCNETCKTRGKLLLRPEILVIKMDKGDVSRTSEQSYSIVNQQVCDDPLMVQDATDVPAWTGSWWSATVEQAGCSLGEPFAVCWENCLVFQWHRKVLFKSFTYTICHNLVSWTHFEINLSSSVLGNPTRPL